MKQELTSVPGRPGPGRRNGWRRLLGLVAGWALLVLGAALLVLPGPGWPLIFAGLALLAAEYHWARRSLHYLGERARRLRARLRHHPAERPPERSPVPREEPGRARD